MTDPYVSPSHRRGINRLAAVFALVVLVGGGVLAYRHFFMRPGEAAIQLIPGDAVFVATIDLNPAPDQVPVFHRIAESMRRENFGAQFDSQMTSLLSNSKFDVAMRPLVKNNIAVAAFKSIGPKPGADQDIVLFLALEDVGKAAQILAQYGAKNTTGSLEYYNLKTENINAAIIAGYLVISSKAEPLARVQDVYAGKIASVARLPEYKEARAALPANANVMAFVSPVAMQMLTEASKTKSTGPLQNMHWSVFGLTIRDQGIDFVSQTPMAATLAGLKSISQIAPLDSALLKRLPSGAYGVTMISQPAHYWAFVDDLANSIPDGKAEMEKGLASFEKETGIGVTKDILPGLNGHCVFAVYPDKANESVDCVLLFDDFSGADPAALADKVRTAAAQEGPGKNRKGVHFAETQRNGATTWTLDDSSQSQLTHTIEQGVSPSASQGGDLKSSGGFGGGASQKTETMVIGGKTYKMRGGQIIEIDGKKQPTFGAPSGGAPGVAGAIPSSLKSKTVAYAKIGHSVLIASNQKMLDRAIAAFNSGSGTLADDAAYAQMAANVRPGAQGACLINLPLIMEALQPMLTKSMSGGGSAVTPQDLTELFGPPNSGIILSHAYDGKVITMQTFLPLNFEKLIHIMSVSAGPPQRGGTPPPSPSGI